MKSTYKVPEGKLIKIQVELENDTIKFVQIFGDFFLHPEDCLEEIELTLMGALVDEKSLADLIESKLEHCQATLIGARPQDIAHAIYLASVS